MPRGATLIAATALALALAGTADASTVFPTAQDYGSQNVGSSTAPVDFQLTPTPQTCLVPDPTTPPLCDASSSYATSTAALGGGPGSTVTSGDFVIHNVDCPYQSYEAPPTPAIGTFISIPCHFQTSFMPVAGGPRSLTLNFPDTGGSTATLTLTGTGVAPTAVPSTSPVPNHKRCKRKHHHASAAAKKKCKKKRR